LRPTVRVLLAGIADFDHEALASLENDQMEIVGTAADADDALRLIDRLQPDVVVAGPALIDATAALSASATIVFLSPGAALGPDPTAGGDLVRSILSVASAAISVHPEEGET
jgi:DNA-binding NarL/FixJ family response regulator